MNTKDFSIYIRQFYIINCCFQASFKVVTMGGKVFGRWELFKVGNWLPMNIGDYIYLQQPIRFRPNEEYNMFNGAYLIINETSINVTRHVTQLVAPAKPPIAVDIVSPYLEVLEDEMVIMSLGDLITVSSKDKSYKFAWDLAINTRKILIGLESTL